MSGKKVSIIVLVLLLVGAVLAVVFAGFFQDSGKSGSIPVRSSLATFTEWAFGSLAPSVPLSQVRCNGKSVRSTFKLTERAPQCEFDLDISEGKYGRSTVEVTGSPVDIYFVADVDPSRFKVVAKNRLKSPRLELTYVPDGESKPTGNAAKRVLADSRTNAAITVLDDGGRMTLACIGCKGSQSLSLRMK